MSNAHFDILIIGAGLAGVGTAARLSGDCPGKSMALLERREAMGGTWDLFRYPGIRSDTDMYTYGYLLRPWDSPRTLGDGDTIRQYIVDTAQQYGIDKKIHYGLKIISADWSSQRQLWQLQAEHAATGQVRHYTCAFLISCTGYYNPDEGFRPAFPGEETFGGLTIHPQHWPKDLDYAGKRVVVIGSGATAITLVPAMAEQAGHVTMLQRSPTYILSLPAMDTLSTALRKVLPKAWVYRFARKRFVWLQRGFYLACRRWPEKMREIILKQVRKQVGPDVDMRHFTPSYMPWDQRVCVVPDADLFEQVKTGGVSMVTAHIDTFTAKGIRLESGEELEADIIITATGLNLQMLGGMALSVDSAPVDMSGRLTYKSVLLEGVPNFGWIFGGGNAPWTLRVELAATYLGRLIEHMDATGQVVAVAHDRENSGTEESILGLLNAGYVKRGSAIMPRQGKSYPWLVNHHLGRDKKMLLEHPITDRWLEFSPPHKQEVSHARTG